MSQLNNRNSDPTIPAIPFNRFNSIDHLSNNYAGSLVNNIHFSDERIKSNIANLTSFINTLLLYITKVSNVLRYEFNKYMQDLKVENNAIQVFVEYKKADSTYKQIIKKLENFSSDIAQDYNKVLQWAMELDVWKRRYLTLTQECSRLKESPEMYQEYDSEFDFDRGMNRQLWKRSSDLKIQRNKIAKLYNEKFSDYNQFIARITILRTHITEGRIFYKPILNDHRDYAISLRDFVDQFGKVVSVADASSKKRGEVIAKLVTDYVKHLDKTMSSINLNATLQLDDINLD